MTTLAINTLLQGTGVIWQGNVNSLPSLTLFVDDNGAGSTITFETSTDNSSWGAYTGVYKASAGVLTALGASTTTAKGQYWVDLSGVTYFRARVSTYVSGNVQSRIEESGVALRTLINMLVTGLVAQGASQATAWPIQAVFNVFATVAASTGAILPTFLSKNTEVVIKNGGANALTVYPGVGYSINGGSANAGVSLAAGASARYVSDGAGNYWSF